MASTTGSTTTRTARVEVDTDLSPPCKKVGQIEINGRNYEVELIELDEQGQAQSPSNELAGRVDAFSKEFVKLYIESSGISIQGNETILKGPGQDDIDNGDAGPSHVDPDAQLKDENESTFNGILGRIAQERTNPEVLPRPTKGPGVTIQNVWDNILGQPNAPAAGGDEEDGDSQQAGIGTGAGVSYDQHPPTSSTLTYENNQGTPGNAGQRSTDAGQPHANNAGTRSAGRQGQHPPTSSTLTYENNQGTPDTTSQPSRTIAYRLKKVQNNRNTGSPSPMGEVEPEAGSSNTFDPGRTTDGRGSRLLTETSERNEPAQPRRTPSKDLRNALSQASSDAVGDTASGQPNIFSRFSAWLISN